MNLSGIRRSDFGGGLEKNRILRVTGYSKPIFPVRSPGFSISAGGADDVTAPTTPLLHTRKGAAKAQIERRAQKIGAMPPKAGRKRARESTGTASNNKAATASSSSAPGSAPPASRRTRSNSATSQQEEEEDDSGGGENAPRATKRSRRGGAAGRDTDSNDDDVDMGESAVANGGGGRTAAARKGSRRKSTSAAVVANGEVRVWYLSCTAFIHWLWYVDAGTC